jgi:hypothetical protein
MTLVAKFLFVTVVVRIRQRRSGSDDKQEGSLYRKSKTPKGWKRYPASMSANGKVKPNTVMVSEVEAAFPVGHYELRSFEGSKTVWTRVESNAADALATLKLSQKRAAAIAIAGDAGVQVIIDTERLTIADQAKKFVAAAISLWDTTRRQSRVSPAETKVRKGVARDLRAGRSQGILRLTDEGVRSVTF